MRPNSTSHRAASDGLRRLHLKCLLRLILALRVLLTRPYLRRGAPKRAAIGILLGPQLGGDRPILRGKWCRNSQPRTASRSSSPTCHVSFAPTQKHSSNPEPSPLPRTPRQGPPSPAKNSTTGLTPRVLTTLSLFRASSRTQTTDVEVVPHRTPRSVLAPSNGPKPCNSLQLLRLRQMGLTGC